MKSKQGLLALVLLLLAQWAVAAETIRIKMSQGQLVRLPDSAQAVFIADPLIANYQAPSSQSLFVFGLKPGTTTLYALDEFDQVMYSAKIQVVHDLDKMRLLISKQFPELSVRVSSVAGRIFLEGKVPDAVTAEALVKLAEQFASRQVVEGDLGNAAGGQQQATAAVTTISDTVVNQLQITNPNQVNIRVRIAEISRNVSNRFGFSWGEMVNGSRSTGLGYRINWSESSLKRCVQFYRRYPDWSAGCAGRRGVG